LYDIVSDISALFDAEIRGSGVSPVILLTKETWVKGLEVEALFSSFFLLYTTTLLVVLVDAFFGFIEDDEQKML
jgi:hypothetical protein